jgi:hypothetical protein
MTMAYLGDLLVRLKAETADFQSDMGKAAHVAERRAKEMEAALSKVQNAIAALGVGALAAQQALEFRAVIDGADHLNKLSQRVNMSVASLSELGFAASLADVDMETFGKGMRDFNRALVDAQDPASKMGQLMRELGVNVNAAPADALKQFADAFAALPEGALRTEVAMTVLKKAGDQFIPLLLQGSKGMEDMADKARKLGVVIDADFAASAEAFNDNLKMIGTGATALKIALGEQLLPGMASFTNSIVEATLKGEKWLGVFREMNKLVASGFSMLPGAFGQAGDRMAQQAFGLTGGVTGGELKTMLDNLKKGPSAKVAPAPEQNQEALTCIMSGGKWVGGKCVRESECKATKEKVKDDGYLDSVFKAATSDLNNLQRLLDKTPIEKTRELLDSIAKLDTAFFNGAISPQMYDQAITQLTGKLEDSAKAAEKLREAGARVFAETRTPLESFYIKMEELNMLLEAGAIDWDTYERAGGKALEAISTKGETAFKDLEHAIRGWGNSFTNTLADVVTGGKADFNDLANSIIRDLARIQIQRNITDPLLKAGTGMLDGLFKGGGGAEQLSGPTDGGGFFDSISNFLGFRAAGGPVSANGSYMVGEQGPELFTPDVAGNITPNHAMGGTSVTSVNHFHIDARSDQASIMATVSAIVRQNDARTRQNLARRGQKDLAGAMG